MEIGLRIYDADGAKVVEATGDIELHNAPNLREELKAICEIPRVCCVIDMTHVPFIDSTGVGVLVGALKRARENGGTLTLACPQPRVRRVFEITGLLKALPIFDSLNEATGACRLDYTKQNS